MEIKEIYDIFCQYPTVTTDSRNCPKDSIFFALKGENFNGNKFAKNAWEQGCAYAFVDEAEYADNEHILLVDNCLRTLQKLAEYHRIQLGIKIIGITGSNGKTTTKELIAAVLSKKYHLTYTKGNLNNQIGVPLTLLSMKREHELAIVEMGASHPGDIKELVDIAHPNLGLITNVGTAHILGFGSFEGVLNTKCELYDYLKKNNGKVFYHNANSYLSERSKDMDRIAYGKGSSTEALLIGSDPFLTISWNGMEIKTNLIGSYNFENVLASIAVGSYLNVEAKDIVSALTEYTPTNSRSQFLKTAKNDLIVDAYNANPTSMSAALHNFQAMKNDRKVVILGDMKELGHVSEEEHQKIADFVAGMNLHSAFLIGPNFEKTNSKAYKFNSVNDLIAYLKDHPISDSLVLVKGSNSMKLTTCLDSL